MSAKEIESISLKFNELQTKLQESLSNRQKLETQNQENLIVLKEFNNLSDDSKIYKLTGSVLLPQDFNDAKVNVEKRLEFIKSEISKVEDLIKTTQTELETTRNSLIQLRTATGQ
ncbi:hypothetical protein WICMUC_004606 [Wickerhamomyces mucosus]|uniref:Prefoldin subunit 6 n=1 Tax=Wickerhamomyces mucosus TaxID=1378264 RepID=A0A9P8PGC3_9ASCO|nr:hypothetical protein WICMUC_004606 [Wickerhamomyces mucosus]